MLYLVESRQPCTFLKLVGVASKLKLLYPAHIWSSYGKLGLTIRNKSSQLHGFPVLSIVTLPVAALPPLFLAVPHRRCLNVTFADRLNQNAEDFFSTQRYISPSIFRP